MANMSLISAVTHIRLLIVCMTWLFSVLEYMGGRELALGCTLVESTIMHAESALNHDLLLHHSDSRQRRNFASRKSDGTQRQKLAFAASTYGQIASPKAWKAVPLLVF